jgi:hypothetical protein
MWALLVAVSAIFHGMSSLLYDPVPGGRGFEMTGAAGKMERNWATNEQYFS